MAVIPEALKKSDLSLKVLKYLKRVKQGKTCDLFTSSEGDSELFILATDRLSIFNFVLPDLMPDKGELRTAFIVFFLTEVLNSFSHHLIAYGRDIDKYLPEPLRNNAELQKRMLRIKKLDIVPVECIVRNYLTGSGWESYQKDGTVAGVRLPTGLKQGSKLPFPIFYTTEKSETDDELHPDEVIKKYGKGIKELSLGINNRIIDFAEVCGFLPVDFKLEFGYDGRKIVHIADETVGFESGWWTKDDWEVAMKKGEIPTHFDKEVYREWGRKVETPWGVGIDSLDPKDPKHIDFIHKLHVPLDVTSLANKRAHFLFCALTAYSLRNFQEEEMGIKQKGMDPVHCYD